MTRRRQTPPEFATRERCFITEYLNDERWPEVSLARARVEPAVTTERHALAVLEWYIIEAGTGELVLGDAAPRRVGPGDCIEIPPGCEQQITNTGKSDLLFLCVCVPRFTPAAYRVTPANSK
jgi:mannose-6-phosphate isomerase-like protein (cupin superfamily)